MMEPTEPGTLFPGERRFTWQGNQEGMGDLVVARNERSGTSRSRWRPTAEERALIAAGADIELIVLGQHPPVAVGVAVPLHFGIGDV